MSIKKETIPPHYDETFKDSTVKIVVEQGRVYLRKLPQKVFSAILNVDWYIISITI